MWHMQFMILSHYHRNDWVAQVCLFDEFGLFWLSFVDSNTTCYDMLHWKRELIMMCQNILAERVEERESHIYNSV